MDKVRTPVQVILLLAGIFHIALGVAGFIGPWVEGAGAGGEGELFGFFAVNGALNVFNLIGGAVLLLASASIPGSVWAARAYAVLFAALAVWGAAEIGLTGAENTLLAELLHVNVVNNWTYIALAAIYAIAGFVPQMWRAEEEHRGRATGRQRAYR